MPTSKKNTQTVQSQSATKSPDITPATPPAAAPPAAAPPATPPAAATPATSPPPAAPVDPNAMLEQYVAQTVASLDTIEVGLGDDPSLTPAEKRHGAKLRKGGENIFAQIGNLAQQQQLESPSLNVSDLTTALGKASALQPLANRVAAFSKHIEDVIFMAQSQAVVLGLQLYALLKKRAAGDVELATAMTPVTSFFAYRHPSTKAPGTPTKRQKRATAKAVKTLKKTAPGMLQQGGTAAQAASATSAGQSQATQGASGQGQAGQAAQAGATAPAGGGAAVAPSGNGAASPTGQTGAAHS
jgi:hypothetical protein